MAFSEDCRGRGRGEFVYGLARAMIVRLSEYSYYLSEHCQKVALLLQECQGQKSLMNL
jgi:hypothetical protein